MNNGGQGSYQRQIRSDDMSGTYINPITKYKGPQNIRVVEISPVQNRGALRAFVNLQLGGIVINDCRIIKEPGKNPWVSMPVLSYKNQFGTIQYRTLIEILDKNLKNEISKTVLEVWEKNGGRYATEP
jgi:DNA-binding cell septation regulator SpoVG